MPLYYVDRSKQTCDRMLVTGAEFQKLHDHKVFKGIRKGWETYSMRNGIGTIYAIKSESGVLWNRIDEVLKWNWNFVTQ